MELGKHRNTGSSGPEFVSRPAVSASSLHNGPFLLAGYDVVEWLTDNLDIEDQSKRRQSPCSIERFRARSLLNTVGLHSFSDADPVAAEALHLANLLCQHGYFFPVSDNAKTFTIKDDSTLYRFQVSRSYEPYFQTGS